MIKWMNGWIISVRVEVGLDDFCSFFSFKFFWCFYFRRVRGVYLIVRIGYSDREG